MSRGLPGSRRPGAMQAAATPWGRATRIAATIVLPAGAAIALLAVVTDAGRSVDRDLQLVAPEHARSGTMLPVRARLFAGLGRPHGPALVTAELELVLRARDGRVLARGRLSPSYAHTLEALLPLPREFAGAARLEAGARDDRALRVQRWLHVGPASALPPVRARELPALQSFAEGPVRAEPGQIAPDALEVKPAQGACVPERPCELLVHVGEPAASVRLSPSASASPDARSAAPSVQSSGAVALRVVTHGPEAQLTLIAERGGVQVASRALRLPIALGAEAMRPLPRVLSAAAMARATVGLYGDEAGCIVDAFHEGQWLRTGVLRACRGAEALPFAALGPGLWRLQLRRDPFGSGNAAVSTLYVRAAGETDEAVLSRLARAALAREPDDALARAVRDDPGAFGSELEPTSAYLLALLDAGVIDLPRAVSSYPHALSRMRAEQARLRALCLLVLSACALTLGLLVAQRGLRAAAEASRLMRAAGEEPRRLQRQRARMALSVLATVTSLLLAFVAIAVYMIVRARAP